MRQEEMFIATFDGDGIFHGAHITGHVEALDVLEKTLRNAGWKYDPVSGEWIAPAEEDKIQNEIRRLRQQVQKLKTAFRVNILRFGPAVSHEEIDKVLAKIEEEK